MKSSTAYRVGFLALLLLLPLSSICGQTLATNSPLPPGVTLSPQTADLLRMVGAGVGEDVVLAYIQSANTRFNLSADAIVYLKDAGISKAIIAGMLNHDLQMKDSPQPVNVPPANPQPQIQPALSQTTYVYDQKLYAPTAPVAPIPQPSPATVTPVPAVQTTPVPATAPAPASLPPSYVADAPPEVGYFYQDLLPYGSWVYLEGYGWCWQPRVVMMNHDWRPYCDGGYWVSTDAGWYWQSTYTWGWAPFHYGRWHYHDRVGWVWFPDTVWGPAWVVWRSTDNCCGWAPLPYRAEFDLRGGFRYNGVSVRADFDFGLGAGLFTFVAFKDFGEHDYRHHCMPPVEVTRVYNHTTIINTYVVNENHVVVNRGIPREHIEAASHTKFQTVSIHNEPTGVKGSHFGEPGAVYKHELKAPAAPVHMVAQKVDQQHPTVQHALIMSSPATKKPVYTPVNAPVQHQPPQQQQQPNHPTGLNNNSHPQNVQSNPTATVHPTPAQPSVGHEQSSPGWHSSPAPQNNNQPAPGKTYTQANENHANSPGWPSQQQQQQQNAHAVHTPSKPVTQQQPQQHQQHQANPNGNSQDHKSQ